MSEQIRYEDAYIYPRARALVERYGGTNPAARAIVEAVGGSFNAYSQLIRRTLVGLFIHRRPSQWTLPWHYDVYHDRPCSELEFREIVRNARTLVATHDLTHKRPSEAFEPPTDLPRENVVTEATGIAQGQEVPSILLEPKFDTKEVPRDFDGLLSGFKRAQAEKNLHEASQVRCRIDLRSTNVPIAFMGMSDIHWGSQDVDYTAIGRHVEMLKTIPNLYAICAGDVGEYAKTKHRHALEGQIQSPTVQARGARSMFVATWDKWWALVMGNHDERIFQETGFDIGDYYIGELPNPEKKRIPFLRDGGLVVVEVGAYLYTINVFHGDSSFGTRFNPNHKGFQVARMVDGATDIVMNGHTHNPSLQDTFTVSDDMQPLRDILLIQLGSYKVLGDDHARRRKFAEVSDVQMGGAILFPDAKRVLGFKRVEDMAIVLESVTALYENGGSITQYWPNDGPA